MERIAKAIQTANKSTKHIAEGTANIEAEIELKNHDAIATMMGGESDKALDMFFDALKNSGKSLELRAQCLANIGDWVRRFGGDINLALDIFTQAGQLNPGLVTSSRLCSMSAMTSIFKTESGQNDSEGVKRCIELLKEAIKRAQKAQEQGLEGAVEAESFALHRLLGTICNFGAEKDKLWAVQEIARFRFLHLTEGTPEASRFEYCEAMIIGNRHPLKAARMLEHASDLAAQRSVFLDAYGRFYLAAKHYLWSNDSASALRCIKKAEGLLSIIKEAGQKNAVWLQKIIEEIDCMRLSRVRLAKPEDSQAVWKIRNHPEVRRWANSPKEIPFEQHDAWFQKKYAEGSVHFCFVLVKNGRVIGYRRFDYYDERRIYIGAIAISPKYQGKGLGTLLNQVSLRKLESAVQESVTIEVQIFKNNPAAMRMDPKIFNFHGDDEKSIFLRREIV